MKTDGKQLEALVAFVEARLLPRGFDVKSNERVFNDEGNQVAEFDIEIRGKVGSTSIAWLIECRDRPGHGAAPGSWIEQLVGRRTRFGFNKVTAVSTTGFAAGAIEFAEAQGIELREVRALDASEFCGWLQITSMQQVRRVTNLRHATFGIDPSASNSIKVAAMKALQKKQGNDRFLISTSTSEVATASEAFFAAVHELKDPFKDVSPESPLHIRLRCLFPEHDHYVIDLGKKRVRIHQIEFIGELRIEVIEVPIAATSEYRHSQTGQVISQVAAFEQQSLLGVNVTLEMHHLVDTVETHVVMRRHPDI